MQEQDVGRDGETKKALMNSTIFLLYNEQIDA